MQGLAGSFKIGVNRKKILPVMTVCMLVLVGVLGVFVNLQMFVNATVMPTIDIFDGVMPAPRGSFGEVDSSFSVDRGYDTFFTAGGLTTSDVFTADIYEYDMQWNETNGEFDCSVTDTGHNLPANRIDGCFYYDNHTGFYYHIGGRSASTTAVKTVIQYNESSGSCTIVDNLSATRVNPAGCYDADRGLYWLIGGSVTTSYNTATNVVSYYNATTGDYNNVSTIGVALTDIKACYDQENDIIWTVGGRNTGGTTVDDVFRIDVSNLGSITVTWYNLTNTGPTRRVGMLWFNSTDGDLFYVGGLNDTTKCDDIIKFDTGTHTSSIIGHLGYEIYSGGVVTTTHDGIVARHICGGRWTSGYLDNVSSLYWGTGATGGGDAEISVGCYKPGGGSIFNSTFINFNCSNDSKTNVVSGEWLKVLYTGGEEDANITELHINWSANIGGSVDPENNLEMCIWNYSSTPGSISWNSSYWEWVGEFTTGNNCNLTVNSSHWSGAVGDTINDAGAGGEQVLFIFRISSVTGNVGTYNSANNAHKVYVTGQE